MSEQVGWPEVRAVLEEFGGRPVTRRGTARAWQVPHPAAGYFTVEIHLRPRWCSIGVDRWHTTDRPPDARQWFEDNIWPVVQAAIKTGRGRGGILPGGGPDWSGATPIERGDVPAVLRTWIPQELAWNTPIRTPERTR